MYVGNLIKRFVKIQVNYIICVTTDQNVSPMVKKRQKLLLNCATTDNVKLEITEEIVF